MNKQFDAAVKMLFIAVETIVNSPGPWKDKAEKITSLADTTEKTNLEEFMSWFEGIDLS